MNEVSFQDAFQQAFEAMGERVRHATPDREVGPSCLSLDRLDSGAASKDWTPHELVHLKGCRQCRRAAFLARLFPGVS